MGHIVSKLLRSDYKSTKSEERKSTEAIEKPKFQPTGSETSETPVKIENYKPMDNSKTSKSEPLRTKLLKSLKLDPRSPTVGIYRTPILVEETLSGRHKSNNFDSPVSIYSCNISDSITQDIKTPIEPSVNVSGFEDTKDNVDCTLEPEDIIREERKNKSLKVSDMPNTYEARRLLDEILSEEENFIKKIPLKKEKKPEVKVDKKTETKAKTRTPLSNITSSTNSPSQVNTGKFLNRNKVFVDYCSENSVSPNVKLLAQWDQNNTVVI